VTCEKREKEGRNYGKGKGRKRKRGFLFCFDYLPREPLRWEGKGSWHCCYVGVSVAIYIYR